MSDELYLRHAHEALARYDLPSDVRLRRISLSENATFLGEGTGLKIILRVYRAGYQSEAAVHSEMAWIEALRDSGTILTPRVLSTRDGDTVARTSAGSEDRLCAVFEHIDGTELPEDGLDVYRVVGATAARLHNHVSSWDLPAGFERRTWDVEAILGPGADWGDWRGGPGIAPADRNLLERAEERIRDRLRDYPAAGDRGGLVHCDLRAANIMVDQSGQMWVIDFDDSGFSWFLWDLCSTTTFIETSPNLDDIVASWLEGYQSDRALQSEDLAVIPDLVFLRRLHLLAWFGTHPESDLARTLGSTFGPETAALAERYLTDNLVRVNAQSR